MSDEVSEQMRIAITIVCLASLLACILNVAIQSEKMMSGISNKSTTAMASVSNANIVRLQNHYRHYIDLYKTYVLYEDNINSITGIETLDDGTKVTHVFYLRNADDILHETSTYINCTNTYSGLKNIDLMYSDFMNNWCDDAHANDYIKVYIYRSTLDQTYDIYYETIDR